MEARDFIEVDNNEAVLSSPQAVSDTSFPSLVSSSILDDSHSTSIDAMPVRSLDNDNHIELLQKFAEAQGVSLLHQAAADGNVEILRKIAERNGDELYCTDKHGWQPIHEAAGWGQLDSIRTLFELGVNINAVSNYGKGWSPLRIALNTFRDGHPVIDFLRSIGAEDHGTKWI